MRKLFTIVVYTLLILIIGRNITFLPKIPSIRSLSSNTGTLQKEFETTIKNQKGVYGVYFVDIQNPQNVHEEVGIAQDQVFTAASVNKVAIVAVLYNLAKYGKIDLDQRIVIQEDDLQDYGTGSIRYQQAGTVYSLKSLARLALNESDNTAAKLISQKIGQDVIQEKINEWGLTQTNMINNKTSLEDTFILFSKIYNNEITTPSLTKELLGFMRDTDFEDRIPLYLPQDVTVFHKTGDTIGGIHDVGIVKRGEEIYFFGVLTQDVGERELETKKIIGELSKKVYDYKKSKTE